jgi:hypothetical protein
VYLRKPQGVCGNQICEDGENHETCDRDCADGWARRFSPSAPNTSTDTRATVVDAAGNLVIAGGGGGVDLGGGTLPACDAWLAKLSPAGGHLWSKCIETAAPKSIAADSAGNIVVLATDGLVAKYSGDGTELWSQHLPGTPKIVTCSRSGDILIAGYFSGTISIGDTTVSVGNDDTFNQMPQDTFIVRLSTEGTLRWAQNLGSETYLNWTTPKAISIDADDNAYILTEEWAFAPMDVMVRKLAPDGSPVWHKSYPFGSFGYDSNADMVVDALGTVHLLYSDYDAVCLIHVNADGSTISTHWVGFGRAMHLVATRDDSVIVTMSLWDRQFIGGKLVVGDTLGTLSALKFSPQGTLKWLRQYRTGGREEDYVGLVVDGTDNVIVSGTSVDTGVFDHFLLMRGSALGQSSDVYVVSGKDETIGELCNGVDDDGDGAVDEGYELGSPCDSEDSDFCTDGVVACTADGSGVTCAESSTAHIETCNGIDDDCNGIADDQDSRGHVPGSPCDGPDGDSCYEGVIQCGADGSFECTDSTPTNPEICNGLDDDCNGLVDQGLPMTTFYLDWDGDGYGQAGVTTSACAAPPSFVSMAGDCSPWNSAIGPGATEVCNRFDDDCDGLVDENVTTTFYRDADGDGFGGTSTIAACTAPAGYVTVGGDCNDWTMASHPSGVETCNGIDDDCDGLVDENLTMTFYFDRDGDGFGGSATLAACMSPAGWVSTPGDCDDSNNALRPNAAESCNGLDDDCDGLVDENLTTIFYRDADGDGFGGTATIAACTAPAGYVATSTDCNDASAAIRPGAPETCNLVDDDCDSLVDENVTTTFYRDADGDGFGGTTTITACTALAGYVATSTDCNDASAAIRPDAAEACNLVDDDCDGLVDENVTTTFYRDADGDGFGGTSTIAACTAPAGYVATSTDCNDASAAIRPGAPETCNLVDDDCDSLVDENVTTTFYRDADGDGFGGSASGSTAACTAPAGYVATSTDCNDASATIRPDATESCNGLDDDCDGLVDEAITTIFYRDMDGDTYGASSSTTNACTVPAGYVARGNDCDDTRAAVKPLAPELANGLDDDCDTFVDEVGLGLYQDTAAFLRYTGTWTAVSDVKASGGTYREARSVAATTKLTFTGSSVTWYTRKDKTCGIASVSIDGQPATLVDLYAKTTTWNVPIPYPLAPGMHTIEIRATGSKNAAATSWYVDVDALEVR